MGGHGTTATIIDLGVLPPATGDDEFDEFVAEFEGAGPALRPSPWLAVAVVLACCATALTSAGQPAEGPRLLFSAIEVVEAPRLIDDGVLAYVDSAEGPALTAFDLGDGAVRWQYRPVRRVAVTPAGPVVLVAPTACQSAASFATEALDSATGTARWRQRGAPVWLVADSPLAVFKQPVRGCSEATVGFDPMPSSAFVWAGVDLNSGEVRWTIPVAAGATLTAGVDGSGRARWFAVAEPGLITAYDLRTGAVAGTLNLPLDPVSPVMTRFLGAGDRLLTVERSGGKLLVSAFAAPALVQRWWTAIDASPTGSRLELNIYTGRWCGPMVCLGPPTETVALDPETGQEVWRLPGRPIRIGPKYALFVRAPATAGLALFTLYDVRTGRERVSLPESDLLGRLDDGVLLTTPGATGGTVWRLELSGGGLQPVASLPRLYVDCDAAGRYLACRGDEGGLDVWRLPARGAGEGRRRTGEGRTAGEGRAWPTS